MTLKNKIKYFIKDLDFLRAYNSPFKAPKLKWYCGKVALGTPYFLPRKWVYDKTKRTSHPVPKKIGFDFVPLGWKTKWERDDYRFEWSPRWSFVFFKWQIAVTFVSSEIDHYWECWLYYHYETKGTTKERLEQARKGFPCVWTSYRNGEKTKVCYWDLILKNKWL